MSSQVEYIEDHWDPKEGMYYNKKYVYPAEQYKNHVFDPKPKTGDKSCQLCPFSWEHDIHIDPEMFTRDVDELQSEVDFLQDRVDELEGEEERTKKMFEKASKMESDMNGLRMDLYNLIFEYSPNPEFK